MMKKYLILMIGLFLFVSSYIWAKEYSIKYGDTTYKTASKQGCSDDVLNKEQEFGYRVYLSCLRTVEEKDYGDFEHEELFVVKDKVGSGYVFQESGLVDPKKHFLIIKLRESVTRTARGYHESKEVLKEGAYAVAFADARGNFTMFTDASASNFYDLPSKISFRNLGMVDVAKEMEKKNIPAPDGTDDNGDGLGDVDTDGDGVKDKEDHNPFDSNDKEKINPDTYKTSPRWINDNHCNHISDCAMKKECRASYKKYYYSFRNRQGSNPKENYGSMKSPTETAVYNNEYQACVDKKNAIQQAEDNNTSLKTQVMNLKEYCNSRKTNKMTGLVKYDGVCDETDGATALFQMMDKILEWLRNIIIITGSALLFWGGVLYVKSAAEPKEKENAKKLMTRVAIGMIFVLFAFAIVQLILDTFADGGVKGKYSGLDTKSKLERSNN